MTNLEVITMIEKLHKTENNSKWKVRAALIGLGLCGIIYVLYRSVQTKSKLISIQQNEIEAEKESKLHIGFLNSQLNNEVVEQKGIIENLSRDKQQLMNTIAQLQETKQES
ncbi:MAG: hypothetical protein RLZZ420_1605 [Bacteroidota bacterium]